MVHKASVDILVIFGTCHSARPAWVDLCHTSTCPHGSAPSARPHRCRCGAQRGGAWRQLCPAAARFKCTRAVARSRARCRCRTESLERAKSSSLIGRRWCSRSRSRSRAGRACKGSSVQRALSSLPTVSLQQAAWTGEGRFATALTCLQGPAPCQCPGPPR